MRDEILCNHIPDMLHHHRDSAGSGNRGIDEDGSGTDTGRSCHTAADEEA